MQQKIRELVAELERAGFVNRGGKGSHRNFDHPKVSKPITVSGVLGEDAKCKAIPNPRRKTQHRGVKAINESTRYAKIVEWSDEDQCFVGSSPGLINGGCHGPDEKAVFEQLCQIVEETIALYHQDGKLLPPPTSGRVYANKMQNVA